MPGRGGCCAVDSGPSCPDPAAPVAMTGCGERLQPEARGTAGARGWAQARESSVAPVF